jgi:hypothetical protein
MKDTNEESFTVTNEKGNYLYAVILTVIVVALIAYAIFKII